MIVVCVHHDYSCVNRGYSSVQTPYQMVSNRGQDSPISSSMRLRINKEIRSSSPPPLLDLREGRSQSSILEREDRSRRIAGVHTCNRSLRSDRN